MDRGEGGGTRIFGGIQRQCKLPPELLTEIEIVQLSVRLSARLANDSSAPCRCTQHVNSL